MLVLSRKIGARLHIGDGITITVLRIQGKSVRIGISAPPEVQVRRPEAKKKEKVA